MGRRSVVACVFVIGLAALVSGQQKSEPQQQQQQPPSTPPSEPSSPQQQPPPVFRSTTELVRVDVSVLDRDGNPVRSLNAADFELRENGELQSITSFKLVNANGEPTDDLSLPIRSPEHAAHEASRDDVRMFLIFWDEYHIDQFGSAVRAREQLERFVLESFGPTDLVGLMDQLTPVSALRFSRDRRALADQVHLLRGRRGVYVPTRSAVEDAHLRNAQDVERIRAQVTASALKSAIAHLGTMRQGRKAVVLVSETLGRLGHDALRVVSDLIRTANDNNTAIYTVDPRGLQAGPGFGGAGSLLSSLADATGADSIVSNDIVASLRKVVSTSSSFYLLGYSPRVNDLDGKFREIKVRVKQPGMQVRSRNGYWAPRGADLARARAIAAAAALPSPIAQAFKELTPTNSRRAADFWIGQSPAADGAVTVNVAWTPRSLGDARAAAASVALTASVGESDVFRGPVTEQGISFKAAPGTIDLDLTVRDSTGEVIDREQREIEIGSPAKAVLALTTPVLSRVRNAAEMRAIAAGEGPIFAGREFIRTDRVLLRVVPYGTNAEGATVMAQLLGPRGNTLAELPVKAGSNGAYQVDLPLTSLAAGEFVVAIAARTAADHVETYVPLRVR